MSGSTQLTTTRPRLGHCPLTAAHPFLKHPVHIPDNAIIGRVIDVSDRLLICSSSNMRNEVVVGSADHALYSIDVLASDQASKGTLDSSRRGGRKPYTVMYSKTCGHTDWVTSVTHLSDGRVLSSGMDGKLCLWSETNRSVCVELENANATGDAYPVAKVLSDSRYNVAFSCSYSGVISIWSLGFHEDTSTANEVPQQQTNSSASRGSTLTRVNSGRNNRRLQQSAPMVTSSVISAHSHLNGHTEPVLECSYREGVCVSGDKGGAMLVWDINRAQLKHRFRAHPGPISSIEIESNGTIITSGTEGGVKLWDPRLPGTGLVWKMQPFMVQESSRTTVQPVAPTSTSASTGRNRSASTSRRSGSTGGPVRTTSSSSSSSNSMMCSSPAVSALCVIRGRGSTDASYIVVGSGGGGGGSGNPLSSSVAVMDLRRGEGPQVVSLWSHSRNGIYSLCSVGDECVLVGDGVGKLLCYSLLEGDVDNPDRAIKYGVGASSKGAVRSINCLGGKVAACGEDGKVLILDYEL